LLRKRKLLSNLLPDESPNTLVCSNVHTLPHIWAPSALLILQNSPIAVITLLFFIETSSDHKRQHSSANSKLPGAAFPGLLLTAVRYCKVLMVRGNKGNYSIHKRKSKLVRNFEERGCSIRSAGLDDQCSVRKRLVRLGLRCRAASRGLFLGAGRDLGHGLALRAYRTGPADIRRYFPECEDFGYL